MHKSNLQALELETKDLPRDLLFYQTKKEMPIMQSSKGIYFWDQQGNKYIDACSGAIICNIGHGDPRILQAIEKQAKQGFFAYRTQFENEPGLRLAKLLVDNSAEHLDRVFYVSGGSEAVESAIKLCRQYFVSIGQGQREIFISRTPSYHGSTMGALSLTSYAPLEIPYRPMLKPYPKIPAPYCYRCAYAMSYPDCGLTCARALEETILQQGPEAVAAFVVEPVVGASIGALVPPEPYFDLVQDICRKYGIMLIFDEVMTGFGRTGKLFAYEHWNVKPDIVALSKGMGSGYFPLGAVMSSREIVDAVLAQGGFPHGFTSAGNPMGCAVGLEVLRIILQDDLAGNAARRGEELLQGLRDLAARHDFIGQVRGRGLLTAFEIVKDKSSKQPFPPELNAHLKMTEAAFEQGLIIYPRRCINGLKGDHILIAPPLIVSGEEVKEILARLSRVFRVWKDWV